MVLIDDLVNPAILAHAAPGTPVAVVQSASLPAQRQLLSTLQRLPDDLLASGLGSPSIIVVGEVVRCADAWDDHGAPGLLAATV